MSADSLLPTLPEYASMATAPARSRRPTFTPLWLLGVTAFGLVAGGCSDRQGPLLPDPEQQEPPVQLSASATDPTGDVLADSTLAATPDLVGAQMSKFDGTVSMQIRFADGSYDGSSTVVLVLVDSDMDAATGIQGSGIGTDEGLYGADHVLFLQPEPEVNSFVLQCAGPTNADCQGMAAPTQLAVTQVGNSGLNLQMRDVFFGLNDPVRFKVGVFATEGVSVAGDVFLDYLSDEGLDPVVLR